MSTYSTQDKFFSPALRTRFGRVTLYIAILSFLTHLILCFIHPFIPALRDAKLLASPINAIYTPFSFLLVYEAYLLLYYLPKSTSEYIGKQYEIISLILIRGIFKDITYLDLGMNSQDPAKAKLWFDLITVLLVFGLIYLFNRMSRKTPIQVISADIAQFISAKKRLSVILLYTSILLAGYSLVNWILHVTSYSDIQTALDINSIFFDHFFTLLIISDVIILLVSLFHTDDYALIIRNSGFVISTILLKLSFAATGLMEQILILAGVLFGVSIYALANLYSNLKETPGPDQKG